MTEPLNSRQQAAVARRAAEIIQARGKATRTLEDTLGRVCALGAIVEAREEMGYGASRLPQLIEERAYSALQSLGLMAWSDLPTTTEHDIAKVFLQVADDLEVAP